MSYLGSKGGNGVCQFLINNIPPHDAYYEFFAGSAQLFRKKKPANFNWLNDLNKDAPGIVDILNYFHGPSRLIQLIEETFFDINSAGLLKPHAVTSSMNAMDIINALHLNSSHFLYLDPPYPFESRRDHVKNNYKFELSNKDHVQLLQLCNQSEANIMISTRQNSLYPQLLKGWRMKEFQTTDRGGVVMEQIWMNYPEPNELHEYTYLGENSTDRQRINRKVARFKNKLSELPILERNKIIQAITDL